MAVLYSSLPQPFHLLGDSYSSSPDSTPMGSIDSLSSHSSEQNSAVKPASSQPREKAGGVPWIASTPSSNGQKNSGLWTTSPESSSKEDATKTDVESDCQSVTSITGPETMTPPVDLTKRGLYSVSGMKRSTSSSIRSLPSAEGKTCVYGCFPFSMGGLHIQHNSLEKQMRCIQ